MGFTAGNFGVALLFRSPYVSEAKQEKNIDTHQFLLAVLLIFCHYCTVVQTVVPRLKTRYKPHEIQALLAARSIRDIGAGWLGSAPLRPSSAQIMYRPPSFFKIKRCLLMPDACQISGLTCRFPLQNIQRGNLAFRKYMNIKAFYFWHETC